LSIVSLPLPAAVAAALVLAIGLAVTATLASLPTGRSADAPVIAPTGLLAVEPAPAPAPATATRSRLTPVG
jgi:hypothetical protein